MTSVAASSQDKAEMLDGTPWSHDFSWQQLLSLVSYMQALQLRAEGTVFREGVLSFLRFMTLSNLNANDAYSMYLRLPSELGLLGVGAALFFVIKNRVPEEAGQLAVISNACLVFFVTYCLREGHYFRHELWFFVAIYAYLPLAWQRLRGEGGGLSLSVNGADGSTGLGAQTPEGA